MRQIYTIFPGSNKRLSNTPKAAKPEEPRAWERSCMAAFQASRTFLE